MPLVGAVVTNVKFFDLSESLQVGWVIAEIINLIFLFCFCVTYYYGRHEMRRKDGKLFQNLRLGCIIVVLARCNWPVYHFFDLKEPYNTVSNIIRCSYDIILPVIVALVCLRIFQAYYTVLHKKMPGLYLIFIISWCIITWGLGCLEFVHFNYDFDDWTNAYQYYSLAWVS